MLSTEDSIDIVGTCILVYAIMIITFTEESKNTGMLSTMIMNIMLSYYHKSGTRICYLLKILAYIHYIQTGYDYDKLYSRHVLSTEDGLVIILGSGNVYTGITYPKVLAINGYPLISVVIYAVHALIVSPRSRFTLLSQWDWERRSEMTPRLDIYYDHNYHKHKMGM